MKTKFIMTTFAASLLLANCEKRIPNVAPEPDTETSTSVEAAWMFQTIADIEMIGASIGENERFSHDYRDAPLPLNGTMTPSGNPDQQMVTLTFNNTRCVDGVERDGSVFMDYGYKPHLYPQQTRNSVYYTEYGFVGDLTLSDYKVDNWLIDEDGGLKSKLLLRSSLFNPAEEPLSWEINGKISFVSPDGSKKYSCDVSLIKILRNSTDRTVFRANGTHPAIIWQNAVFEYHGRLSGEIDGQAFSLEISAENALVRDWNCTPDAVLSVTDGQSTVIANKRHPVSGGMAVFRIGKAYPRQIFFGDEGDRSLGSQCDNTGTVLIQGNSHKINFR